MRQGRWGEWMRERKGEGKPEEEGRGKTGDRTGQLAGLQLDTV